MLDLTFAVEEAVPLPFAASPHLAFKLRISQAPDRPPWQVHNILLRCQIRIEPARRRYEPASQHRLLDLFGEPQRWGQTLQSMLWTHVSVIVQSFTDSILVEVPVPCTHDFNVAATRYFAALEDGEVPLCLLFSGSVFYRAETGELQVAPIPWEKEASYRLPVQVWQQMMDYYYPNSAWICLRRDTFDRLCEYRSLQGLPTWEQALDSLLSTQGSQP